jgi:hypothetical protein
LTASKARGTAWETAICKYLQENGVPYAERRALNGKLDRGDVAGIPSVVLEAKATKALALAQFMDEAETERVNDKAKYGAVVFKRRQKNVSQAAVILPLWQFVDLLKQAEIIR